jgi:hypothetical protein
MFEHYELPRVDRIGFDLIDEGSRGDMSENFTSLPEDALQSCGNTSRKMQIGTRHKPVTLCDLLHS